MHLNDAVLRDFIIDAGLLSRRQLEEAATLHADKPLSRALVESGAMGEDEVRRATAHALGVPFVMLELEHISDEALMALPEPLCRVHNLVAYRAGQVEGGAAGLEVALLDLSDLEALEPLRGVLPQKILPRLTTRESLRRALMRYQKLLKERFGERLTKEENPRKQLEVLLTHAVHQHASEVHLHASSAGLSVRYRLGRVLHEAMRLPAPVGASLTSAVRALANVGSRSLPQEGRFTLDLGSGVSVVARVSSVPLSEGERLVLRLLSGDSSSKGYSLEGLGLHGAAAAALRGALHARRGLVLVCGQSGSGRTTLLYTMLDLLNAPELFLASVEEEPAMRLPYVAQAAPKSADNLTMAATLRALLRQDPDVVMLDRIADRDTLTLALSAAARGTLVLASIDASDVASGLEKLRALGASAEDLRAVACAVAVSLVRKLCDKQARDTRPLERRHLEPLEPHADFARVLGALKDEEVVPKDQTWKELGWARVTGCSECEGGYRGQVGLFELVVPGERHLNLYEDGLYKAAAGITSVAEVLRFAQARQEKEEM